MTRFELVTSSLGRKRSTTKLHPQSLNVLYNIFMIIYRNNNGEPLNTSTEDKKVIDVGLESKLGYCAKT